MEPSGLNNQVRMVDCCVRTELSWVVLLQVLSGVIHAVAVPGGFLRPEVQRAFTHTFGTSAEMPGTDGS